MKTTPKYFLLSLPGLMVFVLFLTALPARSQEAEPLSLRLNKEYGTNLGADIQGTFSLRATGPEDLARVIFYLDDQVLAEDSQPPFRVQFNTGSYPTGDHSFSATGFTTSGQELASNQIYAHFLAADEAGKLALRIVGPILAVVFGAFLLSFVMMAATSGKLRNLPPGAPRSYGISGGTVCPNCHRPFGMHFFGLNLLVGKLDRCPFCGKWSLMRRASPAELRQAEQDETNQAEGRQAAPFASEEDRLRKELDDSRYRDA